MTAARVVGILVIIIVAAPIFAVTIIPLILIYLVIREFYRRFVWNNFCSKRATLIGVGY